MYPSFFRFKKLVEHEDRCKNEYNNDNGNDISDIASITTTNIEEFKLLFRTQEKACYELRSEVTVLKMKLEVANEMIKSQSKKIQSLKMKKNKLITENIVYKNIFLCNSSLTMNTAERKYVTNANANEEHQDEKKQHQIYPPPPPPPLPLPPPQNKLKVNGNSHMNSVLDELKSKIKLIE